MKIAKGLFFQLLLFHSSIFSFRFFFNQKITDDFFWHLKVLNISNLPFQFENHKKIVRVAVLDTFFHENQKIIDFYRKNIFHLATNSKLAPNSIKDWSSALIKESVGGDQKDLLNLKFEGRFLGNLFKKNHGACVASLIRQCAPEVQIISIPIFNDQAVTSLQNLLQGLKNALQQNVDILYLGLKIENSDEFVSEKKEILNLLAQFPYVVAPSGNDGLSCFTVAFPANSIFFSVGAFQQKNNQYLMCDFSQKKIKNGPNFVMPGKNIGCFLWNDQNQKMELCLASGTSMAGACMVGCLALILSESEQNFTVEQIEYLVQKNSKKLNTIEWDDQVNFGMINVSESLFCIHQLKAFQNQMSRKKFQKNFKKLVDQIVRKFDRV